jgi:GPI-anchor transamidase subunit T
MWRIRSCFDSRISFAGRWQGLRNALAGLFCASLGELDERRTTSPVHAFQPDGDLPAGTYKLRIIPPPCTDISLDIPHHLVYAYHPSENICTENLTPFLKLLPCKSRSGIASLLNPHRLFDADWHGMSIRVLWKADHGIEVQLGVQAVFDPVRLRDQKKRGKAVVF